MVGVSGIGLFRMGMYALYCMALNWFAGYNRASHFKIPIFNQYLLQIFP